MNAQQADATHYEDQLDYKGILAQRINAINFTIERGGDGVRSLALLWSNLKADIQDPIREQIAEQTRRLEQEYKSIEDEVIKHYGERISPAHKRQIIETEAKPIIQQAVLNSMQLIINQLDEMGLLLRDAKIVPVGTMKRLNGATS